MISMFSLQSRLWTGCTLLAAGHRPRHEGSFSLISFHHQHCAGTGSEHGYDNQLILLFFDGSIKNKLKL